VVEQLLFKLEALSSNPSPTKKKKKIHRIIYHRWILCYLNCTSIKLKR
jgi:hypothetical protein